MPEHIDVTANGLRFRALSDGPADGPLALCLHGFPDSAWTWRHLLPELASAGFRAVAPWLRGYAPTEVPSRPSYGVGALVADVEALHDALGGDGRAVLIGHDWGAIAAYPAASFAPERWSRVVTMAVPPPAAMGDTFLRYEQLKRSFYVFLFQTPIAELAVGADDLAFIDGLWRDWSPGYDARRGPAQRQGRPAGSRQPVGGDRLLPGHAGCGAARPGLRGGDGRPDDAAPAHAVPARRERRLPGGGVGAGCPRRVEPGIAGRDPRRRRPLPPRRTA
jgi:pimeloyl-ACP methyl ester carboxylesterase